MVVGRLLAENSAGALRFGKIEALASPFDSMHNELKGKLASVTAYTQTGELLLSFPEQSDSTGQAPSVASAIENGVATFQDESLVHTIPVFFGKNNKLAGVLVLNWSHQAIVSEAYNAIKIQFFVAIPLAFLVSAVVLFVMKRVFFRPLHELEASAADAMSGTKIQSRHLSRDDAIGEAMRALDSLGTTIRENSKVTQNLAAGDLSAEIVPQSKDDLLGSSLKDMVSRLKDVIASAQRNSISVADGSHH